MEKRKSDEKGFTLIEVIVTLILVGITAALAGMWIVSVVNGYIFTKMNASTVQKAQLSMTRLAKEFVAITAVTASSDTGITYTRTDNTLGSVTGQSVSKIGSNLKMNTNNTLTDSVSAFSLAYCDSLNSSCVTTWSSTSRIIQIKLTLTAGNNTPVEFVQRVTPRNL